MKLISRCMELKKCPFCGGKARMIVEHDQYSVVCDGAMWCEAKQGWFSDEVRAILVWNRRASDEFQE